MQRVELYSISFYLFIEQIGFVADPDPATSENGE